MAGQYVPTRRRDYRLKLYSQQFGCCAYCGAKMDPRPLDQNAPNGLTLDHVTPVSRGGKRHDPNNHVAACHLCNKEKSRRPMLIFLVRLATGYYTRGGAH